MITSREHRGWPLDTEIHDLTAAGLAHASIVRMKIFTLDERLLLRRAGTLAATYRAAGATRARAVVPAA